MSLCSYVVSCSVHQFFECFDGLRNSQSALGNSGMWNWTCSVFSAITAASNLASGSLLVPSGMFFGPNMHKRTQHFILVSPWQKMC